MGRPGVDNHIFSNFGTGVDHCIDHDHCARAYGIPDVVSDPLFPGEQVPPMDQAQLVSGDGPLASDSWLSPSYVLQAGIITDIGHLLP
jgi:hypothetical protein